MIFYDFRSGPTRRRCSSSGSQNVTLPDYRPTRNRDNNWGFDAAEQNALTYTGMGLDINVHDQWAVESMGPIQDRTVERLGVSDRAVTSNRRLLLKAIKAMEAGQPTPGLPLDEAAARELTRPAGDRHRRPRRGLADAPGARPRPSAAPARPGPRAKRSPDATSGGAATSAPPTSGRSPSAARRGRCWPPTATASSTATTSGARPSTPPRRRSAG